MYIYQIVEKGFESIYKSSEESPIIQIKFYAFQPEVNLYKFHHQT